MAAYVLCGLGRNPSPGWHASDMRLNVCIQLDRYTHMKYFNKQVWLMIKYHTWSFVYTFFPSVSKAERISRLRMPWDCWSCEGSVLWNWLSPMTFWVRSRSPAQFSCVGSRVKTDLKCSRSFTTTQSYRDRRHLTSFCIFCSIRNKCQCPFCLAVCSPCWWHYHGRSSQTAPWPAPSGCDSSSPRSYTHPANAKKGKKQPQSTTRTSKFRWSKH